jgi:hypothetical protein
MADIMVDITTIAHLRVATGNPSARSKRPALPLLSGLFVALLQNA